MRKSRPKKRDFLLRPNKSPKEKKVCLSTRKSEAGLSSISGGDFLFRTAIVLSLIFSPIILAHGHIAPLFKNPSVDSANNVVKEALSEYFISGNAAEVNLTKAVIHHTASGCWTTVEDIDRWHKERKDKNGKNWEGIGYHFVIYCDGSVHRGRRLHQKGAHAKGRNRRVGIAVVGNDTFTVAQRESLKEVLNDIGVLQIEAHHIQCPGRGINLEELI